jgi:hypothetical protein
LALAVGLIAALGAACGAGTPLEGQASTTPVVHPGKVAKKSHVVVIVMENKEQQQVIGSPDAPYLTRLARRSGSAPDSFGVAHPSLPNYIALISGSTQGITDDCTDCSANAPNIAGQLDQASLSWGAYLEGLPAPCARPAYAGRYAKKHDPFAYDDAIAANPKRCARRVPLTRLAGDIRRHRLADFVFIAPDLCNDTHDCPVSTGDRFLRGIVPGLLPALGPHGYLVITYDEGSTDAGCCGGSHGGRIATVVAGPDVRAGARTTQAVDHYGVLASIETSFGLAHLGAAQDAGHGSLAPLFRNGRLPNLRSATAARRSPVGATPGVASARRTPIRHLWVVMMENTDWSAIKGASSAPYINNSLLAKYAHAENYRSHAHNSLPNYMLLEAGDPMDQLGKSPTPPELRLSTTDHLATYLTRAKVSWKSYRENLPGNGRTCPLEDPGAPYSADHNAPVYFDDFTGRTCIAHERPLAELTADLGRNRVPQYSFIVPNDYNQGEKPIPGGSSDLVGNADNFLQSVVPRIQASAAYRRDGAILVLWDEGAACCDNPSGLIAVSRFAKRGYASDAAYSHPSTLRTIQDIFGLRPYLRQAAQAPNLQALFTVPLSRRP